jgi:hypothetical protein
MLGSLESWCPTLFNVIKTHFQHKFFLHKNKMLNTNFEKYTYLHEYFHEIVLIFTSALRISTIE